MRLVDLYLRAVVFSVSALAACGGSTEPSIGTEESGAREPVATTSGGEAVPSGRSVDEGMFTVEGVLGATDSLPVLRYALDVPEGAVLVRDEPTHQVWEATFGHQVIFIVERSRLGVAYLANERSYYDIVGTEGDVSWRADDTCGPETLPRTDCFVTVVAVVPTEGGLVSCTSRVLLQSTAERRTELRDWLLARCRTIRGR